MTGVSGLSKGTLVSSASPSPLQHYTAYHGAGQTVLSTSVAVVAEKLLRSRQKIVILIIKIYMYTTKVSKNRIIQFQKKPHCQALKRDTPQNFGLAGSLQGFCLTFTLRFHSTAVAYLEQAFVDL